MSSNIYEGFGFPDTCQLGGKDGEENAGLILFD